MKFFDIKNKTQNNPGFKNLNEVTSGAEQGNL